MLLLIILFLRGSSWNSRRGNHEGDQESRHDPCNGKYEDVFNAGHVSLEYKSKLSPTETIIKICRACCIDPGPTDLRSCAL
ncbi:MAG: hypothetical protein [Circular genetic element sp.]|nr:MAG: hypothetical protein [Circular genetic element sp.]